MLKKLWRIFFPREYVADPFSIPPMPVRSNSRHTFSLPLNLAELEATINGSVEVNQPSDVKIIIVAADFVSHESDPTFDTSNDLDTGYLFFDTRCVFSSLRGSRYHFVLEGAPPNQFKATVSYDDPRIGERDSEVTTELGLAGSEYVVRITYQEILL